MMDPMYVIVYDSQAKMSKPHQAYQHADGYGRTIMFVRSDDFMNWYLCSYALALLL